MKLLLKRIKTIWSAAKAREIVIPMMILLMLPSAISVLFGAEFMHLPFQKVPTVIVNHDNSESVQSLVQMITENRSFDVVELTDQDDAIENAFYHNTALAGIIIPPDFSEDLLNGKDAKIMIFNDGALSTVASAMRGTIAETLGTIQSGYLMKLAEGMGLTPQQAKTMVAPMGTSMKIVSNPSKNVAYMMMEGVILTILQIGVMAVGTFVHESGNPRRLIKKGFIIGLAGTVSAFFAVAIQTLFFGYPWRSSILVGIVMTFFICVGYAFFGMFMTMSSNGSTEEAVQKCSIIGMTMLLAGYTYPLISMPAPCRWISWFMPNTHYVMPIRDMALSGRTLAEMFHHIVWLAVFALLMLVVACRKLNSGAKAEQPACEEVTEG